ncbi:zinc-finger domain-containing protein [Acidocella sp.]|uniref:zinc-finger domain-containing protein n=1 Tax=Acidocella sp. TaxID=50710 RepID=UPI0026061FE4|nr:zinc-finger domain-containing protein [Acidocella sp.]
MTDTTTPETVLVKTHSVSCDGGVGPLGHPRIYLRIVDKEISCPYCSKRFVLEDGAVDHAH